MSDMIDTETNDEILDAIRALDDRLRKVEREVAHLAQAMNDADLLDVDEDEFD
jgi:hypothetical protein